ACFVASPMTATLQVFSIKNALYCAKKNATPLTLVKMSQSSEVVCNSKGERRNFVSISGQMIGTPPCSFIDLANLSLSDWARVMSIFFFVVAIIYIDSGKSREADCMIDFAPLLIQ